MSRDNQKPADTVARAEVEISATPEQVWQAIATSAGNAGWLFPADIEEREGGAMVIHRQPYGGDAAATVTAYDPPRRFAFEEPMDTPDLPPWATEFLIEARGGGTTVVRLVSGFHGGGEGWEAMVDGAGEGWAGALQMLRHYAVHFLGQRPVRVGATGDTGQQLDERPALSRQLLDALNLTGLKAGEKFRGPDDAPPLVGSVEDDVSEHGCIVRTEDPAPGLFEISTFSMNGQTTTVNVDGRLFGDGLDDIAERDAAAWADWLQRHFPSVGTATLVRS